MRYHQKKILFFACLIVAASLSLFGGRAGANEKIGKNHASVSKTAQVERAAVTKLKKAIVFYRGATWRQQDVAYLPRTPTTYPERWSVSRNYLHWDAVFWRNHLQQAKQYVRQNPWARMLKITMSYRQCLIDKESRTTGLYHAENGGTRYANPSIGDSNASGAYQFLDGTWQSRLASAKTFFKGKLVGHWMHASDAPPKVQDIVAAYSIAVARGVDWTHPRCRAISLKK